MQKILIVDEDIHTTTPLHRILMMNGYEAVVTNDGASAVQLAMTIQPDLILLDLMMPESKGLNLCRSLRTHLDLSNTPIIVVIALNESESRSSALEAGASSILSKPYGTADLIQTMKTLLA